MILLNIIHFKPKLLSRIENHTWLAGLNTWVWLAELIGTLQEFSNQRGRGNTVGFEQSESLSPWSCLVSVLPAFACSEFVLGLSALVSWSLGNSGPFPNILSRLSIFQTVFCVYWQWALSWEPAEIFVRQWDSSIYRMVVVYFMYL